MGQERLYLDYNATSPLSTSVLDWLKRGDFPFANPASQHSAGKYSRKVINEAREQVFQIFSATPKDHHLFFHSGATEGIHTFALSFSQWSQSLGRELLICYSELDHPAVTTLSQRFLGPGVSFYSLKMTENLEYDHAHNVSALKKLKQIKPDLIILYHHLWVHNETGIISPLSELIDFKKIPDLYIHVDSVQAPGKVDDWNKLLVGDIFTFSGHKFGSLKGVGFSLFSKSIKFFALFGGGGQQGYLRSGTENPMGAKSISLALSDLLKVDVLKVESLRVKLEDFLHHELSGIGEVVSSKGRFHASNTVYFYLNDLSSDIALALFDLNGLMISAGSACSSGAAKESVVMSHLGLKNEAKNGLRISFSYQLEEEELELIMKLLGQVFLKIKGNYSGP